MNGLSDHDDQVILINGEKQTSLQLLKCRNRLTNEDTIKQFRCYLGNKNWKTTVTKLQTILSIFVTHLF